MLIIAILSSSPGCGRTTIMVNLGIGLQRKGFRVLIATGQTDIIIHSWLNPTAQEEVSTGATIEKTAHNVDLLLKPGAALLSTCLNELKNHYDYLLMDAGFNQYNLGQEVLVSDIIMSCVEAGINDQRIFDIEKQLRHLSRDSRGIDIIVPTKARSGEWESNVEQLMTLTEFFGEERIADFIPFCEAIHDLPKEKKSVWDLPQHYSNRKQAFDRLVDRVLGFRL